MSKPCWDMCCWLPWWLSISVPRLPNLECFSAFIPGWTYPSPFPTQTTLPTCEAFAPLRPSSLSWAKSAGQSLQANPTSHDVPWPQQQPLFKNRWATVDPNWLLVAHMWNVESLPYTHPLQTLAKWLFPAVTFTASQPCLVRIITFLDFWGCLWINESISNLLKTRVYCTLKEDISIN